MACAKKHIKACMDEWRSRSFKKAAKCLDKKCPGWHNDRKIVDRVLNAKARGGLFGCGKGR